jgi:hypothetical protein
MDPELLEELLDGEYDSQDYPITPPPSSQLIDTSQFSQIGFCVRVSDTTLGKDGRSRLERASERLQEVCQALCRPPITATAIDIQVHGISTKFLGMRGNVEELKGLFNSPGSALVVSVTTKEREQNRQTTSSINHNRRDCQTQECYLAMTGSACRY